MPIYAKNVFLLLGTIVGAGIFSLPLALRSGGYLPFVIILVVLSFFTVKINTYFREIVESSPERHQLKGYAAQILGIRWSNLTLFLHLFSIFGSMLAYLILGGEFMSKINIQSPENNSFIFWAGSAALLLFAGRALEIIDVLFTFLKMILLAIVIYLSLTVKTNPTVLSAVGPEVLFCYGAILFSITGFSIIPELKKDERIKQTISLTQAVVFVFYALFAFITFSLVKGDTLAFLVPWQNSLFSSAGIVSVFTPYLMMAWVAYDSFDKDLGFSKKDSLILVTVIPLLLFLFGFQNFMAVVSVTGSISLGGIGIIISRMYQKQFPGKETKLNYLIQLVFLAGVVAEVIQFIK
jgi:amino acid permease